MSNNKKANNDNHANQLNKNNPEYGNARNNPRKPVVVKTKEDPTIKEANKEVSAIPKR